MGHPTHPSFEYLLVAAVAAAGCFVATPIARLIAVRISAIARPRDRDVHAVAIPRLGGLALLVGFVLALYTAHQLPTLRDAFDNGPEMPWIVGAGALICVIGALDDRFELDSLTKLAGQVLAAGIMVTLGGVQLTVFYLPWGGGGTVVLGQDLSIPVTILLTLVTINAINFIDGLDGLAAGVTAISALSFFAYSYHLGQGGTLPIAAPPTLLCAALAGTCIGFLPHNFFPARIFMGDSGSMLVGLMLSAAATTATTNADPQTFDGVTGSLPLVLPLLVVLAVLAIPFVDLLLAIVRRVSSGHSPFAPDKRHLHHRLLELGHSHRRAVLLLYFWSALLGFGGAALSIWGGGRLLVVLIGAGAAVGVLLLAIPRLRRRLRTRRLPRPAGPSDRPVPVPRAEADAARDAVATGASGGPNIRRAPLNGAAGEAVGAPLNTTLNGGLNTPVSGPAETAAPATGSARRAI